MILDLDEFLRTGRLLPVQMGMLRSQIVQLLGPPPASSPRIDRYGDLQLFYRQQQLTMIYLDDFERPTGTERVQLKSSGLRGRMSKASLLDFFERTQIGVLDLAGSQPAALVTRAGVKIGFEPAEELFALWLGSP